MYPGQENTAIDFRFRGYFTPAFWSPQPEEDDERPEWDIVRPCFQAARAGRFEELERLLDLVFPPPGLTFDLLDPQTGFTPMRFGLVEQAARFLLGDAGTDAQLEAINARVAETPDNFFDSVHVARLCDCLAVWGRLSAAKTIYQNYDGCVIGYGRGYGLVVGDDAKGHPGYLTTMLEPEWGPVADLPHGDTIADFEAYHQRFLGVYEQVLAKIGDEKAIVAFGEPFGVRQLAERFLDHLGSSNYDKMMRPFFRRRFEASTGIDCSDFYVDRDSEPLVIAARLEAWLDSPESQRYEVGARYFFGHRIPSST
jgi:hypothetical protein